MSAASYGHAGRQAGHASMRVVWGPAPHSMLASSSLLTWHSVATHTSPCRLPFLCSAERYLYIAMAGQHQIWRMDTRTGVLGAL